MSDRSKNSVIQFTGKRPDPSRPEVQTSKADLMGGVREYASHLAKVPGVYQRGGQLVIAHLSRSLEIATLEDVDLYPLTHYQLMSAVDAAIDTSFYNPKTQAWESAKMSEDSARALLKCKDLYYNANPLYGVTTIPFVDRVGRLVTRGGYDRESGILYVKQSDQKDFVLPVGDPTLEDAQGAARALLEVVSDFPFEAPSHRAAWLAACLTPFARRAYSGTSPFFAVRGNVRGCGKSLLADIISILVTGDECTRQAVPDDEDELRKVCTTMLASGDPIHLLDNIPTGSKFGASGIDAIMTGRKNADREMRTHNTLRTVNHGMWIGTGNMFRLAGDLSRRTIMVSLAFSGASPETGRTFRIATGTGALKAYVRERRHVLVGAALTILRYHACQKWSRPEPSGAPGSAHGWGSFEPWEERVAAAIEILQLPMPDGSVLPSPLLARASNDEPETSANEDKWLADAFGQAFAAPHFEGRGGKIADLLDVIAPGGKMHGDRATIEANNPDMLDAYDIVRERFVERGHVDDRKIGYLLRRIKGMPGTLFKVEHAKGGGKVAVTWTGVRLDKA